MSVLELSRQALRRSRIKDSLPTDHPAVLDEIEELLDALPDPLDLGPDEIVGSMQVTAQLRNRLEAYLVVLAGTADAMHVAQSMHAGTTGTLVAAATGTNPAIGSGIVGTARALRTLPHVADAFRAGTIGSLHVHALRNAASRITDFAEIEQALVDVAASVEPAELRRILALLIGQCQPDAPDTDHEAQGDKRGLSLSETPNGMFRLDGWLDAIEGRRLRDALAAFTDRATTGDTRTPTQARADALADIISAANANTRPLGVSGLSGLVDIENRPFTHRLPSLTVVPGGGLVTRVSRPSVTCRSTWQPTPQKLQVLRTGSGEGGIPSEGFSVIAPVGQTAMQPPQSSQELSSRLC